jgi:hypothetical protein
MTRHDHLRKAEDLELAGLSALHGVADRPLRERLGLALETIGDEVASVAGALPASAITINRMLEVCDCNVLCPCWIGEDPDNGTCKASLAYRFDQGEIDGVDVLGLTVAASSFIPGNVLDGGWKVCLYISDEAGDEQMAALTALFQGKKGGPLADIAALIGEVVDVQRAPITFEVAEGRGRYRVGDVVEAEIEPYQGPTGAPTTLYESIFSTIPGSPAFVDKAPRYRNRIPALGLDVDLKDHNAIQGRFAFEA